MRATAITSVLSHRRIQRAHTWLESRAPAEEVLIIGATLDAANDLARGIVQEKRAAFGWHRLTLSSLAAAIARPELASRNRAPLSRIGTDGIVARVLHRLKEKGGFGRYDSVCDTPGFPRGITGIIQELQFARLPLDAIVGVVPDLVPLIEAYQRELEDAEVTDWSGVLALATACVSGSARNWHRLVGLPTVLLDISLSNEAELAFIHALVAAAPEVLATVPSADEPTLNRIRSGLHIPIENIDEMLSRDDRNARTESALANLQRYLFNEETRPPEARPDSTVEVFSAPGEGRECTEIARRVLSLARNGVPFDRIAVLLRSPEGYHTYLLEAFDRARIPVHFTRGAVRPDPAGRAFCALLKCAAEGLSARRFAEYLSLGQVPSLTPDGAPPESAPGGDRWRAPDSDFAPLSTPGGEQVAVGHTSEGGFLRAPRRWERLLVEAAVIGGRDRWRRRIDGLAKDLRLRLSEVSEEDEIQAATLARTLDDLASFAAYALPLIDMLDALPAAADWSEWLDRLSALATRALKQPDRVLALLAELSPMGPVGPVALNEVLLILDRLLLEVASPPASQRHGKVFIGPIEAARGLSFEAVFVPGLAEKMFPRKIVEEPILLDAAREQIGDTLATNQTRLEGERLAMALAAGAAERRICFSYPRLDLDQARPRVPSFYALEAVRAAEGVLPDFAELARRSETATTARLGWPAPSQSADAIDDAEYDLAVLERIVARPEESAGSARYLVTVNPYLARALRARYQRWGRSWTPADGLISRSDTTRAIMARHALGSRSYSPTALQNYARCPYRFFLQAIQGLAPREVPEVIDELDPLQRGSLIHDVQFGLLARLRKDGLLPVRPNNLDRAWQYLDGIVAVVAAQYRDDLAPAIDRVWDDGIAAIRADLREWLRRASEDESGYVPCHFELSFGLQHRPERRQADPRSVPGAVDLDCGIQLRGSIDLVERHPSGVVRVTDHKTGNADSKQGQLIDGGKSLQPVLYALTMEKLLADEGKISSGRLYFCTSRGGFVEHVVPLNDQARAAAVQVAEAIDEAVAEPFLPAAPDTRQCDICDFQVVCGPYEERRVARKPQKKLNALLALRGLL
jgi:ATP-dependent helicase/nuclease subunit B